MPRLWRLWLTRWQQSVLGKTRHDWGIIVFCVGVAGTIWLIKTLNKEYQAWIRVPVRIENAAHLVPTMAPPKYLNVWVEGRGWDLVEYYLPLKRPRFVIDMGDTSGKRYFSRVQILDRLDPLFPKADILNLKEDTLSFRYERFQTRRLALRVDTASLRLPSGHYISGRIVLSPDSLSIKGPESVMKSLPRYWKIRLPQASYRNDVEEIISTAALGLPGLEVQEREVLVAIPVDRLVRDSLHVPVSVGSLPPGWALADSLTWVSFRVSEDKREDLSLDSLQVSVNWSTWRPGDTLAPLIISRRSPSVLYPRLRWPYVRLQKR